VLAVLGASLAVVAFYQARTAAAAPDSAKWFADEAVWASSVDSAGEPVALTSLVGARGLDPVGSLPLPLEVEVRTAVAEHAGAQMWTAITAARYPNGNSLNVPEVYLATEDEGVIQVVGFATVLLPVVFDPPVTSLPEDVAPGTSWSQEGDANYGTLKLYDYEVSSEILSVDDDGCAVVHNSTTYRATDDAKAFGGTDYDDTVETTVCPGRWITGYTTSSGTTTTAVSAARARRVLSEYQPPVPLEVAAKSEPRSLLMERDLGSNGGADTLVVPEAGVVVDADVSTQTLTGLVWTAETPVPLWRLVGEGPTVVAPVRAGRTVVTADTHGLVTALDAASGFVLWQQRVGSLPQALAVDADGRYVAVLDRSGSAELLAISDGDSIVSVDAEDTPIGVAVATDDSGPFLAVADTSSMRGYRSDGEQAFEVEESFTAGPVAAGGRVFAGTDDGRLFAVDADGDTEEQGLELDPVTDLSAGTDRVAALDGKHLHLVAVDDLALASSVDDGADALSLGRDDGADVFTTTALDGRIRTYAADGALLRTVQAPLSAEGSVEDFEAAQRAAAVFWDGVVWASAVTGLVRWAAR
jgi:outer membrane protein assembly factor BamB